MTACQGITTPSSPRARSLAVFAAVALGAWLARTLAPAPEYPTVAAATLAAIALISRGRACAAAALLLSLTLLSAGWASARLWTVPHNSLELVHAEHRPILSLRAVVLDAPRWAPPAPAALARFTTSAQGWVFNARISHLETAHAWTPVSAVARLRLRSSDPPSFSPGDHIRFTASFNAFPRRPTPPSPTADPTPAPAGTSGALTIHHPSHVSVESGPTTLLDHARATLASARLRARTALDLATDGLDPPSRALIAGLLLGETSPDAWELRESFNRLGLAHLLAISGFHLAVVAAIALALLRLTGDRGWFEPAAVALLVITYALIVPPQSPILRSAILTLAMLAASAAGRRYDPLTILIWVCTALLVWRPTELWALGYQLSCGLTALLVWQGHSFHHRLWPQHIRTDLPTSPTTLSLLTAPIKGLISTTLLCTVVSTPWVFSTTGIASFLALPATLLILPAIVLLMAVGFVALLLGAISPYAASWAPTILDPIAAFTARAVTFLDSIPYSSAALPPLSTAFTIASLAASLWWATRPRLFTPRALLPLLIIPAWAAAETLSTRSLDPALFARADVLAHNSATILRAGPDAILINAGGPRPSAGLDSIPHTARSLSLTSIPTAIITDTRPDSFLALPDAADALSIRRVYLPPAFLSLARDHPDSIHAELLRLLHLRRISIHPISHLDTIPLSTTTLTLHLTSQHNAHAHLETPSRTLRFPNPPQPLYYTLRIRRDATLDSPR